MNTISNIHKLYKKTNIVIKLKNKKWIYNTNILFEKDEEYKTCFSFIKVYDKSISIGIVFYNIYTYVFIF